MPPEYRELVIEFGQGAYVALYRYDGQSVIVLAIVMGARLDTELVLNSS